MAIDRLGSGIYVSASLRKNDAACVVSRLGSGLRPFSKKIPASWVGYGQESGPRVVGRLGSGL